MGRSFDAVAAKVKAAESREVATKIKLRMKKTPETQVARGSPLSSSTTICGASREPPGAWAALISWLIPSCPSAAIFIVV